MNEKIENINLNEIVPHPSNRRVMGFDENKLQSLAESIKAVGVQQPAVVRKIEAGFQLVAGERRWRASALAGLDTLPCVVRDLDDVTALKIRTIENVQREDVHPLDEADGYSQLIETAGYTVEMLAAEIGKSDGYIYQRIKLNSLIPEVKELLAKNIITSGHAILVARLPEESQKEVLKDGLFAYSFKRDGKNENEIVSIRELGEYIKNQIYYDLSNVHWDLNDASILPSAGSCAECSNRTGYNPSLFSDIENKQSDFCTDHNCFKLKKESFIEIKREELKNDDVLEVSDGHGYSSIKNALNNWEWDKCKKSDPGAKKVLIVDGENPGKITYGRLASYGKPSSSEESKKRKDEEKAEEQKRRKKEEKTKSLVREIIEKAKKNIPVAALRAVVQKIWVQWSSDAQINLAKYDEWNATDRTNVQEIGINKIENMDQEEMMIFLFHLSIIDEIKEHQWGDNKKPVITELSKIYKIDKKPALKKNSGDDE